MSRKNGKKKHTLLKILGVILAIFIIILVILLTHTQIIVGAIQKMASGTVNTINTFEPLGEPMKGNKENGQYKGILYGTIELHKCEKEIDCPNCGGTGICSTCNGEKQITCPVCEGETKCIQCSGSGKYTCRHCDGSGECPECDDGWCVCGYCNGEGKVSCPDCCGTGNYIDIYAYIWGQGLTDKESYDPTSEADYIYSGGTIIYYIGESKNPLLPTTLDNIPVTTITFSGTSFVTIAPAAQIELLPMVTPGKIVTLLPIQV